MLSERTSATTVYMPSDTGKKEIPVTMKLSESQLLRLEEICERRDRPRSYVARELMLRGMALFNQDGKLRESDETVASVLATITPDTTKDEIRNSYGFKQGEELAPSTERSIPLKTTQQPQRKRKAR